MHITITHLPSGRMQDRWGRPIYSGPEEKWPATDDRYYTRAVPEPCDDSHAIDSCRLRQMHMGACRPTPEEADLLGDF